MTNLGENEDSSSSPNSFEKDEELGPEEGENLEERDAHHDLLRGGCHK